MIGKLKIRELTYSRVVGYVKYERNEIQRGETEVDSRKRNSQAEAVYTPDALAARCSKY